MSQLFRALAITVLLSVPGVACAGAPARGAAPSAKASELRISGQYVRYINIAFADYVQGRDVPGEPEYADMGYRSFTVREEGEYVIVHIGHDQERLMKERNVVMMGGGAEYRIEKSTGKIANRLFFK